jgi:enamine deaminase RidA (YjgF/YER057c/UK114 family)
MKACYIFFTIMLACIGWHAQAQTTKNNKNEVIRYDNPNAQILSGVYVPAGQHLFFTSGIVAPLLDSTAAVGDVARYGDTYSQAVNTMRRIEKILNNAGFTWKDVVYLRVYLVPDRRNFNRVDFDAWFKAYSEFFTTKENPHKAARTTISVPELANPDLLIEIEAVAAKQ